MPIGGCDPGRRGRCRPSSKALAYMGLERRCADSRTRRSTSCSSAAAPMRASRTCAARPRVLRGGARSRAGVRCWWCRARSRSSAHAEAEGLDRVFLDAGAEWRESGCSMCIGMNGDIVRRGPVRRSAPATATSRAARGRARAPCWRARSPPRPARCAAASPIRASCCRGLEAHATLHTIRLRARSCCRATNIDTDQIIPARFLTHHDARRARQAAVRRLALRRRRARRARTSR